MNFLKSALDLTTRAFQSPSPLDTHGIIIVSGRQTSQPHATPGSDASINIVSGRTPRPGFNDHLTDNAIIIIGGNNPFDSVQAAFEDNTKHLESQDKLENFAIQDLMSQYNQTETLASNVAKKTDDTTNAIIGKI
jgi:hypothetical protein